MAADLIALLVDCINTGVPNGAILDADTIRTVCTQPIKEIQSAAIASSGKIAALSAYAAFSFSACVTYLALPDYRYRRRLTDYVRHLTAGEDSQDRQSLTEVLKFIENKNPAEVLKMLKADQGEEEVPHCAAYASLLQMLEYFLALPNGEHPTKLLEKDKITNIQWFNQSVGSIYRGFYHSRVDNLVCIALAFVAAVIVSLSTAEFFGQFSILSPVLTVDWLALVLYGLLALGFILPALFAIVGKELICESGRKKIDEAAAIYVRLSSQIGALAIDQGVDSDSEILAGETR